MTRLSQTDLYVGKVFYKLQDFFFSLKPIFVYGSVYEILHYKLFYGILMCLLLEEMITSPFSTKKQRQQLIDIFQIERLW